MESPAIVSFPLFRAYEDRHRGWEYNGKVPFEFPGRNRICFAGRS